VAAKARCVAASKAVRAASTVRSDAWKASRHWRSAADAASAARRASPWPASTSPGGAQHRQFLLQFVEARARRKRARPRSPAGRDREAIHRHRAVARDEALPLYKLCGQGTTFRLTGDNADLREPAGQQIRAAHERR
jgi:hypothetical protein